MKKTDLSKISFIRNSVSIQMEVGNNSGVAKLEGCCAFKIIPLQL